MRKEDGKEKELQEIYPHSQYLINISEVTLKTHDGLLDHVSLTATPLELSSASVMVL